MALCAVLDCLGIIKEPPDWAHWARYEWLKWEVQRQQREELAVSQPDEAEGGMIILAASS